MVANMVDDRLYEHIICAFCRELERSDDRNTRSEKQSECRSDADDEVIAVDRSDNGNMDEPFVYHSATAFGIRIGLESKESEEGKDDDHYPVVLDEFA